MKSILPKIFLISALLLSVSAHAGFTSGLIVGHMLTDKNGNAVTPKMYEMSYDPNFQIKCQSYDALSYGCYLSNEMGVKKKVKPMYNSTYDIHKLAKEFLHLQNPTVAYVHKYHAFTIVEFSVIKAKTQ